MDWINQENGDDVYGDDDDDDNNDDYNDDDDDDDNNDDDDNDDNNDDDDDDNDVCNIMLKSDDAYGNFVELQSSYLAANGFTCEDASWDHTVAYLSDTTKVGIRSSSLSSSSS